MMKSFASPFFGASVGLHHAQRPFGIPSPLPLRRCSPLRSAHTEKNCLKCSAEKEDQSPITKVSVPLAAVLAAGLVLIPAAIPDAAEVRPPLLLSRHLSFEIQSL